MLHLWRDAERWEWYAAGDRTAARPCAPVRPGPNAPDRVLWELGLAMLVPLAIAVLVSIALT